MSTFDADDLETTGYFLPEDSQLRLKQLREYVGFLTNLARPRRPDEDREWFAEIRPGGAARRCGADDCVAGRRIVAKSGDARQFLLDDGGELGHLLFHLDHFFAHVENDFDAGEIDAHVARQRQDDVEALEIFVGVEARVALRTRGLE